jgi:hypothetical protein
VGYYSQLADGRLRVNAATAQVNSEDGAFDLIPSNLRFPALGIANFTTNYDRTIRPCYDIGEYMTAARSRGTTVLSYGDDRNNWTSPPQSPAAGRHSQPDVFENRLGSED